MATRYYHFLVSGCASSPSVCLCFHSNHFAWYCLLNSELFSSLVIVDGTIVIDTPSVAQATHSFHLYDEERSGKEMLIINERNVLELTWRPTRAQDES